MRMLRNSSYCKIVFLLILFSLSQTIRAQVYNNEWIVPGQTYYKFKIPADGLYRLTAASLNGQVILTQPAANFQLWRNGVQVPIYVSNNGGVLTGTDYIEFWGEHNDGQVDASLFQKPEDQLNKARSFEGDSSTYFLTINSTVSKNLRYTLSINDAATKAGSMTALPYFMYTTQQDLGTVFSRGPATAYGTDYVYQSDYRGKAFGKLVAGGKNTIVSFTSLNAYTAIPVNAQITVGISGAFKLTENARTVTVAGDNGTPASGSLANFASQTYTINNANVSSSYKVTITNGSTNTADQINASFVSLTYPRLFNFGNLANLGFDLPASSDERLLDISGFAVGGSVPVLYDITNGRRYVGYLSGTTHYQFVLPKMAASHLALVGQTSTSYKVIGASSVTLRNFPGLASNQGDYLIISNTALYGSGNYVQQYADYRASMVGGSYKTHIYNIDDLEDMFAFGIRMSPISIRNFLRYARAKFSAPPKFVFLIGRGLSFDNLQGANPADPEHQQQALVPTYGWPASDIMLSSDDFQPITATPIGRLSAVKPEEIKNYLDKVKIYEASQQNEDNTVAGNNWKKNVVLISGGGNLSEDALFSSYLNGYKTTLSDGLYGANSSYLSKANPSQNSSSDPNALRNYFSDGIGLISYFGHGASTTITYGELNDPSAFNNNNRYPVVFTSGCDVGDCFAFMPGRTVSINNITERFLLTKDKGSVAFVAQSYLGVTSFLNSYNQVMYQNLAKIQYGQPITGSMKEGQKTMVSAGNTNTDVITAYAHAEQTNFLGDPAITLYSFLNPDFVAQESGIIMPSSLSITAGKFHVKAYLRNIGRAEGDSVHVKVNRRLPDGTIVSLIDKDLLSIRNIDSLDIDVMVDPNKDAGSNTITVSIDDDNKYAEISENNNTATKTIFIYANGITPIFPYNYAIIRTPTALLTASTANALASSDNYVMELDTTELFNSPFKVIKNITSIGGAIGFDPGISYKDSTVYYWRVSPVPQSGGQYFWANSSFQYIAAAGGDNLEGAGQSHYDQHERSLLEGINLENETRTWAFNKLNYSINVPHAVLSQGIGYSNFGLKINNVGISNYFCVSMGNSIMFNILTPDGLKPYFNQNVPAVTQSGPNSSIGGFMGSTAACMLTPYSYDKNPMGYPNVNKYNFQFKYQTTTDRNNIAAFMKWIPDNSYVIVRLFIAEPFNTVPLVGEWKADGVAENTLYQQFLDAGLTSINRFTTPGIGVFIYKKGDNSFTPIQNLTDNTTSQIQLLENLPGKDTIGYVTSPKFGPAKAWKSVQWNGSSEESVSTDNATLEVYGITKAGDQKLFYTFSPTDQDLNITGIDAAQYPYVQLKLRNVDSINYTPYQLRYWHVLFTPVPEGALAGNIQLLKTDTIDLGLDLKFKIAFKNISDQPYDDLIKTTVSIWDKDNTQYSIPIQSLKKLAAGESTTIEFTIPGDYGSYNVGKPGDQQVFVGTNMLQGLNRLRLEANPDDSPYEYTLDNNNLDFQFYVNSTLPVTFGTFTPTLLPNNLVSLKWTTKTEINSDYFNVQRSLDGKAFENVAKIKAAGNSTVDKSYSTIDDLKKLGYNTGIVYYRIEQLDVNGHAYYSDIKSINIIDKSWQFKVAPNPILQAQFNIVFQNPLSSNVQVRLIDMTGKVVLNQSFGLNGNTTLTVNAPGLRSGVYILQITQGNNKGEIKLIKR